MIATTCLACGDENVCAGVDQVVITTPQRFRVPSRVISLCRWCADAITLATLAETLAQRHRDPEEP